MNGCRRRRNLVSALLWLGGAALCRAADTNAVASLPVDAPSLTASLLRVAGALVLVIAVFLGATWMFRNGQRLWLPKGRSPKLDVVEVKSLGARQALYVVGYEEQRFLLASSPAGIALLTHLPPGEPAATEPAASARLSFGEILTKAVARR